MMSNVLFLNFSCTFLWMHLAVGYLCHILRLLSNCWCLAAAVKPVSSFLLSFFWCFDFRELIITCLDEAVFSFLFMLILYGLQFIPISLVPCILLSVDGFFLWCSEFVSVLSFCQWLQKLWWHIFIFLLLLFLRNFVWCWCFFQY